MCVGSLETMSDMHTTLCMPNSRFTMITVMLDWRWSGRASATRHIDSTCGLGKEPATKRANGWLARAVYDELISNYTYSF